jgi:hypothetical protein
MKMWRDTNIDDRKSNEISKVNGERSGNRGWKG